MGLILLISWLLVACWIASALWRRRDDLAIVCADPARRTCIAPTPEERLD